MAHERFGWNTQRAQLAPALLLLSFLFPVGLQAQSVDHLHIFVSFGHSAPANTSRYLRVLASGGAQVDNGAASKTEVSLDHAASATIRITYPRLDVQTLQNMHVIWSDLIAHSDADTVRRLAQDPAWRLDPRKVTFQLDPEGKSGFSLTIDQLLETKSFWIPSLDVYISAGDHPLSFAQAEAQRTPFKGKRILEEVQARPEASYREFAAKWPNMGDPAFAHPEQEGPGHIIGLSWDSAVRKFGIDRGAGVRNDYGNPDHFQFWFEFANLQEGISPYWKSQTLTNGLPIVTTTLERDSVRYEVEQFAYPLYGSPHERGGDIDMVLMQHVRMTDLSGHARVIPVTMVHERALPPEEDPGLIAEQQNGKWMLAERGHRNVLLAIDARGADLSWAGVQQQGQKITRVDATLSLALSAHGTQEFFVALPTPSVKAEDSQTLAQLDYKDAREKTAKFWTEYLGKGAQFEVPEQEVNDLFRANLWHALTLPRRQTPSHIDLPYSNFAYAQTGTPWPINQAVYVDYMIYGLRGYNQLGSEEFQTIYANNQEFDGRVNGFAHWLAYTPGMLYAVAQNYLLSNDRVTFESNLPDTLKALDWSIAQIREASSSSQPFGPTRGLAAGPLNDITGSGYWAFNQAYLYAGVELLGKALARYGHPRAAECLQVAQTYRQAIERAIGMASVESPLVQLRDHTWTPYVPSNAGLPGRNFAQWYPSDVDTGATHLLRLDALSEKGVLADALLNDQEDNLFLHGWGLANEPVYNQQATAYLKRDDAKAVIRAFYSLMAGGFSQGAYEPVEHRWRWGQYFGPPSTDGAWFELYRNMLLREVDDHTLLISQAAPRVWMEDGKEISVKAAPSWFGKVSFDIKSHVTGNRIDASFQIAEGNAETTVLLRLRHPSAAPMRSVTVNGKPWRDFDANKEWIRIPGAGGADYSVTATY